MSDNQSSKPEPKKANAGRIALLGAGATALAGGLLALVGGVIMMAMART